MWRYWSDFIITPPLAAALVAYDCRSWGWLGWCLFGIALWTFAEYWTHRTLLHRMFWHSIHQRHHAHPEEYVIYPARQVALYAGAFVLAFFVFPISVFCGLLIGYTWFALFHHAIHHIDQTNWPLLRRYSSWHAVHHRGAQANYGISTPLWDVIFFTYRKHKETIA